MAAVTVADIEPIVNRYYRGNRVATIAKPRCPFFIDVKKNVNAVGNYRAAAIYGDGGGCSADFATAQTNTSSTAQVSFNFGAENMGNEFAVVQVENKTLKAAENKGAIANILTMQMDAKIRKITRKVQIGCYAADQNKVMGQATNVAAGVITFANSYEARRFQVGDAINAAATATGAIRSGTGIVTNVNPSGPTITYSGTITSIGTTDFIFMAGDAPNTGTPKGVFGIPAWLPTSAPSSTLFYGVDRTKDSDRLGGIRATASASKGSQREAIIEIASTVFDATQGDANITKASLPVNKWKRLCIELDARNEIREKGDSESRFGYAFIKALFGPYEIVCYPDPENVTGNAYLLDMDTWEIACLGDVPHIDRADDNTILRTAAAAGIEGRLEAYWLLGCQIPGHNGVGILP